MRRRGEEQATDIKSNNPHLAGGEKSLLKPSHFRKKTLRKFAPQKIYRST